MVRTIDKSKLSSSIESINVVTQYKIILFMSDGSISEADFGMESITICEIPTERELLHPYSDYCFGTKVEWVCWENEYVMSTDNDKYKIEFKTKPKVMHIDKFFDDDFIDIFCVFMDPGSTLITFVRFRTEQRIEIPQSVHCCKWSIEFIDQKIFCSDMDLLYIYIVLWSVNMKSITLIQLNLSVVNNFNSEVMGRINWTDDLEIKHYQTKNEFCAFKWYSAVEFNVYPMTTPPALKVKPANGHL